MIAELQQELEQRAVAEKKVVGELRQGCCLPRNTLLADGHLAWTESEEL